MDIIEFDSITEKYNSPREFFDALVNSKNGIDEIKNELDKLHQGGYISRKLEGGDFFIYDNRSWKKFYFGIQ